MSIEVEYFLYLFFSAFFHIFERVWVGVCKDTTIDTLTVKKEVGTLVDQKEMSEQKLYPHLDYGNYEINVNLKVFS